MASPTVRKSTMFTNRKDELKLQNLTGDFPSWLITNLEKLDVDGSGTLDENEMNTMCSDMRQLKVNQMANCADINYSVFPKAAQDVFKKWDKDASGSVSVTELMIAAKAQEELEKQNRIVKIGLIVITFLCFVLTAATFGVAVGANELTKESKVNSSGRMTDASGNLLATRAEPAVVTAVDTETVSRSLTSILEDRRRSLQNIAGDEAAAEDLISLHVASVPRQAVEGFLQDMKKTNTVDFVAVVNVDDEDSSKKGTRKGGRRGKGNKRGRSLEDSDRDIHSVLVEDQAYEVECVDGEDTCAVMEIMWAPASRALEEVVEDEAPALRYLLSRKQCQRCASGWSCSSTDRSVCAQKHGIHWRK